MTDESIRMSRLAEAQAKAAALFERISPLVRPGITESRLTQDISELGRREFGLEKNWHRRIVRAGANTLSTSDDHPPDRVIGDDDIVFVDLGPVFADWEADFGRTFVLGDDPDKLRLRDDAEWAFAVGKAYFDANPDITGSELYAYLETLADEKGWAFGGTIAAHWVGEFPHKSLPDNKTLGYADPQHQTPMRRLDPFGRQQHWILEIHFVDRLRQIGAFYEELLTV